MEGLLLQSLTVKELDAYLCGLSEEQYALIRDDLLRDSRSGVKKLVRSTEKRFESERLERQRTKTLYAFEESFSPLGNQATIIGLDEVGRGPLAGPLAVGAVVLERNTPIYGLNDSKKLKPHARARLSETIERSAIATAVVYVEPSAIDELGMSVCLRMGFSRAIQAIEQQGIHADIVLIDGNPLHVDEREVNVIKGDATCASIAAASIIAKEARDALMVAYAQQYPQYHFEKSKGYGSAEHIDAIRRFGLCPIHRKSFCTNFTQEALF